MPNNKKDFRLLIKAISTPGKLEKEETGVNIILTKIRHSLKLHWFADLMNVTEEVTIHKLFNPSLGMTCTELKFLAVIQS